jgi:adenine-specific DNA-methyltransferase
LRRQTEAQEKTGIPQQLDLFADFNGLPDAARSTEFYQHDANWTNRMILGDSLQVMASLAEREGLPTALTHLTTLMHSADSG